MWLSTTDVVVPAILVAWFVLVIVPIIILFVYSFFTTVQFRTVYTLSLDTWIGLFESGRWEVTLRTLRIAVTVTLIELVVGFPFAFWLAKGGVGKGGRAICLAMLTIPFFLDMSSRTIVWRAILGQSGLINTILMGTGLTDTPVEWLLYSEVAVHFGMVVSLFPPMVLPIFLAINLIDELADRGQQGSWRFAGANPETYNPPAVTARHNGRRGVLPWPGAGRLGRAGDAWRRLCQPDLELDRKCLFCTALSGGRGTFCLCDPASDALAGPDVSGRPSLW
ncbi:MAG: hypothetical protein V9G14_01780 [Cypionkella sp.]